VRQETVAESELATKESLEVQDLDSQMSDPKASTTMAKKGNSVHQKKEKRKKKKMPASDRPMDEWTEVELLRMVMMQERHGKGDHQDTARTLLHLVARWCDKGMYMEAEPQLERAVGILEATLGPHHVETQGAQKSLKAVYRRNGKAEMGDCKETTHALVHMRVEREKQALRQDASAAAARATSITTADNERRTPSVAIQKVKHLDVSTPLSVGEGYRDPATPFETTLTRAAYKDIKLGALTHVQLLKILVAQEKAGKPDDCDTARILNCLGARLVKKGKLHEAEQMLVRALKILIKVITLTNY